MLSIKKSDVPIEVSIILTCYNYAQYLAECVISVQNQTFKNWECIIIDDGSTDETRQKVAPFLDDPRIKYHFINNSGVAVARNTGIGLALSNYIVPLDADDILNKSFIEDLYHLHLKNPFLTLAYPKVSLFGAETGEWRLPVYSFKTLLIDNMIVATSMFKKTDFLNIGGYDTQMKTGSEDWEMWIRLLDGDKQVQQSSDIIFQYRIKPLSRNTQILSDRNKKYEVYRYISQKHKDIYVKHFESPLVLFHEKQLLNDEIRILEDKRLLGIVRSNLSIFKKIFKK